MVRIPHCLSHLLVLVDGHAFRFRMAIVAVLRMARVAVQKDFFGSLYAEWRCLFVDACEGGRWHHNTQLLHTEFSIYCRQEFCRGQKAREPDSRCVG